MNSNEHENETKGIYIPIEIAKATDINPMDKLLYAVFYYYTQYGKEHSCYATNETLGVMLGVNERTIRRAKKNLLKQELIEVSGNRYVRTKADKSCTPCNDKADKSCTPVEKKADKNGQTKRTKMVTETDKSGPHNKENKELNKVIIIKSDSNYNKDTLSKQDVIENKSDSHQSEPDPVNNNLGIYVEDNTPTIPEWMDELPVTEPWEQYTDDIQGEAMQITNNNTSKTDERENDPDPVTGKNKITSSDGIYGENALNGLGESLGVSPSELPQDEENEPQENETSKLAVLSDGRGDGGTTTHGQGESLSNGEKTTSTGVIDPVTDNVNNNINNDNFNMTVTERKEKQTELTRKWESFKKQVPQMHRADAETYFNRFLSKVEQYYTGTHIDTTQERYTREFNDLKPLADWNEEQAKKDVENWIGQGFNPETIKRYIKQKYGEAHDEFVMVQWEQHYSKPVELNPEYIKNPKSPYVLPF